MEWIERTEPATTARCRYCAYEASFPHWKSFIFEGRTFSVFRCPSCASLIYVPQEILSRVPETQTPEEIANRRIGDKYYLEAGYSTDHIALAVLAALAGVPPAERERHLFVDIGSGLGLSSYMARHQFGLTTITVEPSPTAALGQELLGLDVHRAYIEDLPEPVLQRLAAQPSVMHLNSVIEHLLEPAEVIRSLMARSHIEAIATVVPDGGAMDADAALGAMLPYLAPGDHLHLPTEIGMRLFFRDLGFPIFALRRMGLLLIAVGARQRADLASEAEIETTRTRFLHGLMAHRNPWLAGGAAGRLLPHAVLNRDEASLVELRRYFAGTLPREAMTAALQQGVGWDSIPFHLGPTAFWLAIDAYARGQHQEGHAWCDLVELFTDRLARDYPIYASQTLHLRGEARVHRANDLAAIGEWEVARHWLRLVIDSAGDRVLGASADQVARAEALLGRLTAPAGSLRRVRRVLLEWWRRARTGH
jgi:L-rhamnose mutarotase